MGKAAYLPTIKQQSMTLDFHLPLGIEHHWLDDSSWQEITLPFLPQIQDFQQQIFINNTNKNYLLLKIVLPENTHQTLEKNTQFFYQYLEDIKYKTPYKNILRIWNYFDNINVGAHDQERYKQFCVARHDVLQKNNYQNHQFPAATVIGFHQNNTNNNLLFYVLFSQEGEQLQIENPRQISAFHYPRQYGKVSPSFSRALLHQYQNKQTLFISGTASVVGHQTVHLGDALAQAEEIWQNLTAVIYEAEQKSQTLLSWLFCKTYVRNPEDLLKIKIFFNKKFIETNIRLNMNHIDFENRVVLGDICRADLLVESEGILVALDSNT